VIQLTAVQKSFFDSKTRRMHPVFEKGLNLTLPRHGQFIVLLGPSGCGKSTVLSLISGLAQADEGEVTIFGKPLRGGNVHSATVPQAYTCFPWRTALENVEFGLSLQPGRSKEEITTIAREYLAKVGLQHREHARPRELSGGMQQRVAIARTLAVRRPIVLMDEPFGALDAQTREDMQQMLIRLWEEAGCTIVFVTHDISEALLLADRIIVFSARPTSIAQDIDRPLPFGANRSPDLMQDPEFIKWCAYLRQFFRPGAHGEEPETETNRETSAQSA
jgi:NitT/TauT family transport system ATP-binding protein